MQPIRTCLLALAGATLPGCYVSSVVSASERAVAVDRATLEFRAATAADLPGVYSSVAIEGEVASSLRQVHYVFAAGGTYCAAALVESERGLEYQVRNGSWRLQDGRLHLDDTEPAALAVARDHLRITTASGLLLLRRVALP